MAMMLRKVVETSNAVAATRSRKAKIALLIPCLADAAAHELQIVTAWLTGVLPQGRIGLGPTILREVAASTPAQSATLTVTEVDSTINRLAQIAGSGALVKRRDLLAGLLRQAIHEEQAFLVKLILGDLRQGALEGVMTEAIAAAANIPPDDVRRAVMVSGDLSAVAGVALTDGAPGLACFRMQPGVAMAAMLAKSAPGVDAALAALGTAFFDYKIDGARVQVHRVQSKVSIFSRQLNNVTDRLPEIVSIVAALPGEDLVLDGEVIALQSDGRPRPFQVTMQRFGRQLNVDALRDDIPLSVIFFDLLYMGADLSDRSASERFELMTQLLPEKHIVPRVLTDDVATATRHYDDALAIGHEGLVAKNPDAPYLAGNRGGSWLKIKPAHTLDLVVLAAEWGSGRREGWLSNLHLGAYDPDNNRYVMLGKTFKGLTDEMLKWQTTHLQTLETRRDGHVVHVRPELVVEIAFDGLQRSRQYPGGLALRFARVKAFRKDKKPTDADTITTVRHHFKDNRKVRS